MGGSSSKAKKLKAERFNVCDRATNAKHVLVVEYPDLVLLDSHNKLLRRFPIKYLRAYGQRDDLFNFETGSKCPPVMSYGFTVDGGKNIVAALQRAIEFHKATAANSSGGGGEGGGSGGGGGGGGNAPARSNTGVSNSSRNSNNSSSSFNNNNNNNNNNNRKQSSSSLSTYSTLDAGTRAPAASSSTYSTLDHGNHHHQQQQQQQGYNMLQADYNAVVPPHSGGAAQPYSHLKGGSRAAEPASQSYDMLHSSSSSAQPGYNVLQPDYNALQPEYNALQQPDYTPLKGGARAPVPQQQNYSVLQRSNSTADEVGDYEDPGPQHGGGGNNMYSALDSSAGRAANPSANTYNALQRGAQQQQQQQQQQAQSNYMPLIEAKKRP